MQVEITAEAERDLYDIARHVARDSPAKAAEFIDRLRDACAGLSEFPNRFAFVRRYEHLKIRHRVVGSYLIFYRIESEKVVILHVRHGANDYSDLLDLQD